MIYELITPSDTITFLAPDHKIAFVCAVLIGEGTAGVRCVDDPGVEIPALCAFGDPQATIRKFLGCDIDDFMGIHNYKIIAECYETFAYKSPEARKMYDAALAAITDPVKLEEFKQADEDRNRTSLSQWVKGAWKYAEHFKKLANGKASV